MWNKNSVRDDAFFFLRFCLFLFALIAYEKFVIPHQKAIKNITLSFFFKKETSGPNHFSSEDSLGPASSQVEAGSMVPIQEEGVWGGWVVPKQIRTSHVWGKQKHQDVLLATNFTTLELFWASDHFHGKMCPFLDLLGHRFDNNTYAANVGIGARYAQSVENLDTDLLGLHGYYDYRQGSVGYYNQIGVGVEILRRRWELRGDVYVPFGARHRMRECVFDDYTDDYYIIRRDLESLSYSYNMEIGLYLLRRTEFSLYLGAGPYFLARGACCRTTPGIEARIRPKFKDYFWAEWSIRYDDLFGTIQQVEISVNLPLYSLKQKGSPSKALKESQIYQPVHRFFILPLESKSCWETNY